MLTFQATQPWGEVSAVCMAGGDSTFGGSNRGHGHPSIFAGERFDGGRLSGIDLSLLDVRSGGEIDAGMCSV